MEAPANLGEPIHPHYVEAGETYYYLQNNVYKKIKIKKVAKHERNEEMPFGIPFGLLVVTYIPENTDRFIGFQRYEGLDQPTKLFRIKQAGGRRRSRLSDKRSRTRRRYRR